MMYVLTQLYFEHSNSQCLHHHQDSSKPYKVTCDPTPGYIYLYTEDGKQINSSVKSI
jgi:hypothetical protein